VHGTAPDIAGKGIANPTAVMLAACQLLDHVGEDARANRIRAAIEGTLRDRKTITRDVGGTASTDEYTDAVIARLKD
jgi:isocitrate dehydrogenase (NAD+)